MKATGLSGLQNPKRSKRSLRSILDDPLPVEVALRFKPKDAPKLWDLASRHYSEGHGGADFAKAAAATERGEMVYLGAVSRDMLAEVLAFFRRHGIEEPEVEDLRFDG